MKTKILRTSFLGLFLFASRLSAASITWDDTQTGTSWSTGTNWLLHNAPASGDSVTFSGSPSGSATLFDDIAGLSLVSINNSAAFTQQLNQSLSLTGAGTNDGIIQFGGGSPTLTISGAGSLTSDGTLKGTGGTISVAGMLNLTGGALTGGILSGTGSVSASGTVGIGGITNNATVSVTGGTTTLSGAIGGTGSFTNTGGTLDLADALGLSGGLSIIGNATNLGTAALSNVSLTNGIISNSGHTINVGSQNLYLVGTGSDSGDIHGGIIATSLAGLLEAVGGSILDTTQAGSYNLLIGDGSTTTPLIVEGDSKLDILAGKSVEIANDGTLNLNENMQNDGGTFKVDAGGTVDFASFTQNSGNTRIDGTSNLSITVNGGNLEVSGALNDDTSFSGTGSATVDPGGNGVVGTLTDSGNFFESNTAADSLTIDIQGKNTGSYDVWAINSSAIIDGTLNLDFGGGYIPQLNDAYTILTSNGLTGTFSTINLVGGNGATAHVSYGADDVVVTITQAGATPEPAAWTLFTIGLAGVCLARFKRPFPRASSL